MMTITLSRCQTDPVRYVRVVSHERRKGLPGNPDRVYRVGRTWFGPDSYDAENLRWPRKDWTFEPSGERHFIAKRDWLVLRGFVTPAAQ